MRIAKVQLARSIWLFDTAELNPQGVNLESVKNIVTTFGFTPPTREEIASDKAVLKGGRFLWEEKMIEVELKIHGDGLIADTRHSTRASDAFLQAFIQEISVQLGVVYEPEMTRKRVHRSELVMYSDKVGVAGVCKQFDEFAGYLSEIFNETQELSAVVYGASSKQNNSFTFERKINEPFESSKYYSMALLPTDKHLMVLQRFESILAGG